MNKRVQKLREESLAARPTIDAERAVLITEFYKNQNEKLSAPVERAKAFEYLLENKALYIGDGELIIGERGPAPKATPTYPEVCCHTLEDLDVLNTREKISYGVSDEVRDIYEKEIIPFWKDRSIREAIFKYMSPEWKEAHKATVFTEMMEQRVPGHPSLDDKIYHTGFNDLRKKIKESMDSLDFMNDPEAFHKMEELKGMDISAAAVIRYAERNAEYALELAEKESDPERAAELRKIAEVCSWVPANAPRDFYEALQMYWFMHVSALTEYNYWDSLNAGHLDQHLLPFYEKGLADGTLDRERAKELLECFWVKFNNHPCPPKVGMTAQESATYTDFSNINIGGLKEDGSDAVNEVSYLLLEVIEEMRLLQPSSNVQLSKKNPDKFLKAAGKVIKTGFGQPSIFNADAVVQEMVGMGKSVKDARKGGISGCVETGAFGKESFIHTGYYNMPKVLEITLNDGIDPRTGKRLAPALGDPRDCETFEEFFDLYQKRIEYFVDLKIEGNNKIEQLYANHLPAPFLSLLLDDCISNGKDCFAGGCRYNTTYIMGVGMGTISDCMASIKYHVYDKKDVSMSELLDVLSSDYKDAEPLRQVFLNKTPKYGNDDDYADDMMIACFDAYTNAVTGKNNTKGGKYGVEMLPTTCHVFFGSVIGATPDGRHAGKPLSEGISPVQGMDKNGPTAAIKSVAKMDHLRTGGTLFNQKLSPDLLKDEAGMNGFVNLVRSYFRMDGHHIQFNVVSADTLRKAQKNPEAYNDLIVRVAGYSDYYCDLSKDLQDEIISRTEHESF